VGWPEDGTTRQAIPVRHGRIVTRVAGVMGGTSHRGTRVAVTDGSSRLGVAKRVVRRRALSKSSSPGVTFRWLHKASRSDRHIATQARVFPGAQTDRHSLAGAQSSAKIRVANEIAVVDGGEPQVRRNRERSMRQPIG